MPFFEYVLLALLGSAGTATPGANPADLSTRTVDADAISQPSGGAGAEGNFNAGTGFLGQATGGSTDKRGTGRKGRRHAEARRYHKHYKHYRHQKISTGNKGKKKV